MPRALEVFLRFARLGVTAFGGPIAHLGYFRREFVERAGWLPDAEYTEIVALCTALPGPTSSQVGMLLGARRAGPMGAVLAWLAFTTPSAIVLGAFGYAMQFASAGYRVDPRIERPIAAALGALAYVALAVVLVAIAGMARTNVTTPFARVTAGASFALALGLGFVAPGLGVAVLPIAAIAGARYAPRGTLALATLPLAVSRTAGLGALGVLLVALATSFCVSPNDGLGGLVALCFRAGSLVFGGGHVVLSFLSALAGNGLSGARLSPAVFDAGYGAAQAVPGPLFTFASFLGGAARGASNPALSSALATLAIFAPSALILPAALALWGTVRHNPAASAAIAGINASVTGLLAATLVNPMAAQILWPLRPDDLAIATVAFVLLSRFTWPSWAVIVACAAIAAAGAVIFGARSA